MALPFLPAIRMEESLAILGREILAIAAPGMRDFYTYWRRMWLPLKDAIRFLEKKSEQIILPKIAIGIWFPSWVRDNSYGECQVMLIMTLIILNILEIYMGNSAHNWPTWRRKHAYKYANENKYLTGSNDCVIC